MRSAPNLQSVLVDAHTKTCAGAPVWMSRLREAVAAVIAEGERWEICADELRDELEREQEAHLQLVTETADRSEAMEVQEECAYAAAESIDMAEDEIAQLREELRTAQETIDELLAR